MYKRLILVLLGVFLLTTAISITGFTKSGLDLIPYEAELVFAVKKNNSKLNLIMKNKKFNRSINELKRFGINVNNLIDLHGCAFKINQNSQPSVALIANGRFNRDQIYKSINSKLSSQLTSETYSGLSYLKANKENNYSVVVLGYQFLVVAQDGYIKMIIDLYNGKGKSIKSNRLISKNLNTVREGNLFWFIAPLPDDAKKMMISEKENLKSLENVKMFSVTYQVKNDDVIRLNAICSNNSEANSVQSALKAAFDDIFAMGSIFIKDQSILDISKTIEYTTNGNIATAKITITKETFNKILKLIR
ncbi:MAG: DUF3352 domain-containing protein [Spirochaetota bacterium]|nr:DUF3352 domain-containing protein [Spirochaetota bacterium]